MKKSYSKLVPIYIILAILTAIAGVIVFHSNITKDEMDSVESEIIPPESSSKPSTLSAGVYRATNEDGTVSVMAILSGPRGSNCAKYNHIPAIKADSITDKDILEITQFGDYCHWWQGDTWDSELQEKFPDYGLECRTRFTDDYDDGTGSKRAWYSLEHPDSNTIIETNTATQEKTVFQYWRNIAME